MELEMPAADKHYMWKRVKATFYTSSCKRIKSLDLNILGVSLKLLNELLT